MIASIIIWFLGYYPNHNSYNSVAEQQENSYIGKIGKTIEPAIKPLGFDWKLGIGLLSGVGAKELVVSTLGVLYTNEDHRENANLSQRIDITPIAGLSFMFFVLIYFMYCHPCRNKARVRQLEMGTLCRHVHHYPSLDSLVYSV